MFIEASHNNFSLLIKISKSLGLKFFWTKLLTVFNFSNKQLISIGCLFNSISMWTIIVKKIEFDLYSNKELIELGAHINHKTFLESLFQTNILSNEELVQTGSQETYNQLERWRLICKYLNLVDYERDKLINLGSIACNELVWKHILMTHKLSNNDLGYAAKYVDKKFLANYLTFDDLSDVEILELGNKFSNFYIWRAIIQNGKLQNNNIIVAADVGSECQEPLRCQKGYMWILAARSLKLDNLNETSLISLGKKSNNLHVWQSIINTKKSQIII